MELVEYISVSYSHEPNDNSLVKHCWDSQGESVVLQRRRKRCGSRTALLLSLILVIQP